MTGLSIDTLRAWERRYAAVTPTRDDRGRVYTDADVRRLTLLRDAVQHGHAIGRAASLSDTQLARVADTASRAASSGGQGQQAPVIRVNDIIAALDRFDAATVEAELARAAVLLRPRDLLRDILVPVLTEVGDRWHSGQGRVAHEHMLSASVRNVLGSLLRGHQKAGVADTLLFATPSGERHEFGTLGSAMLAASGGLGAIYLGPDMPADDIVAVSAAVKLEVVVLGMTNLGDVERVEKDVAKVARCLPPHVELWLGGPGAKRASTRLKGRARALPTYDALEQQLVRVGARF